MPETPVSHPSFSKTTTRWLGRLFLIWSTVGAAVMLLGITSSSIANSELPLWIRHSSASILAIADAMWMILAALLILLYRSSQHGWNRASFEFITITFLSGIAEAWGTSTGLLFGNYSYTSGFGWKIGGILPLAIPLAWYVVLQGAFDGARLATNHICHPRLHLILCWSLAATIATLTDLNLEPVAIHVREYWIWWEDANRTIPKTFPPAGNFITWFLLSLALLPFIHFPSHHTPSHHTPSQLKPFHILILINSLFLCGHLGRFW